MTDGSTYTVAKNRKINWAEMMTKVLKLTG